MRTSAPKPIYRDPEALIVAALTVIALALPDSAWDHAVERATSQPLVFGPVLVMLAGRLGLRVADAWSVGRGGE